MSPCDRTHRRAFLKRGVCAAAAVAAPQFIPGRALGLAGAPGANEQIVVGIVGMGLRGRALARNMPSDGRIAAICDADSRKTAAALEEFQTNWNVYDDYRNLVEQKDLNAVIVCPCDHHHVHAGMFACQAGLDLYVEKPASFYMAEGRALVQAARKHKRVVQVGSQQRTMEMDRFACELVRDGGIGKVRVVETVNLPSPQPYPYPSAELPEEPIPPGLNWDLWQGPAAVHPFNAQVLGPGWWRRCRDYSAGPIGQNGTHAYDMIQYAMGADESGPVEYRLLEEGPAGRVRFRYANGVEVRLKYPLGGASPYRDQPPSPGPQMGAIFVGEKCKIEINRNKFTANPKDFVANGPDPKLADKWYGPDWIARPHVQNWLDCIKTRQKPNADVEVGHRSAAICHVINIVRELGRAGETLQWDPASERFTNSKEGNELLDRPRRKGWELPAV